MPEAAEGVVATDAAAADTTTTATTTTETTEPAAQQAKVTDWEAEARKWEKRSKDNFAKLKEAEPRLAELDQIVASRKTDAEKQAEELTRWQTDSEKWRGVALGARIESLAGDFTDPSDALGALGEDLSKYLDAGGQINDDAIRTDLAGVLERKPHWRRSADAPVTRLPAPNAAQGTGGTTAAADPGTAFASLLQGLAKGGS